VTQDIVFVLAGLALLVLAGDALVRGAVNLSLRLGIPALIVGLTVVAFGTSAPELLVSVQAVLRDAPEIAIGNVVGSNIANILLVLGLPAIIYAMRTDGHDTRRSYLTMIAATALFIAISFIGPIRWPHALALLAGLALMLWDNYRSARTHRTIEAPEELEGADPRMPGPKITLLLVAGLIGLPIGADLLVDGAVNIARVFSVSEAVIGLTLVAIGTSLPELATTLAAAIRREADVALGNVIGSNVFNLLGIVGIAGLVGAIPVGPDFLRIDLWVMLAASLMIAPFVFHKFPINRLWGLAFTGLYTAYLVALVLR
jgi:cation:H+ antiporter